MSESKHTPGPWNVSEGIEGINDCTLFRLVHTEHGALAVVYCEDDSFFADPVGLANARLMAAAPKLKEALKGLLKVAEQEMPDTYFSSDSRVIAACEALALVEDD